MISTCIYWIGKYFDNEKSLYILFENGKKRNMTEFFHYTLLFGIRSWILGFIHILIKNNYSSKISTLLTL